MRARAKSDSKAMLGVSRGWTVSACAPAGRESGTAYQPHGPRVRRARAFFVVPVPERYRLAAGRLGALGHRAQLRIFRLCVRLVRRLHFVHHLAQPAPLLAHGRLRRPRIPLLLIVVLAVQVGVDNRPVPVVLGRRRAELVPVRAAPLHARGGIWAFPAVILMASTPAPAFTSPPPPPPRSQSTRGRSRGAGVGA